MQEKGSSWNNEDLRRRLAGIAFNNRHRSEVISDPRSIYIEGVESGVLHLLTSVERAVVIRRGKMGIRDIAMDLGVSRQRVSMAEKSALKRIAKLTSTKKLLNDARAQGLDELLSPSQEAVMLFVYYEGLTHKQAAEILGHSLSHSKLLMREVCKKAEKIIFPEKETVSAA